MSGVSYFSRKVVDMAAMDEPRYKSPITIGRMEDMIRQLQLIGASLQFFGRNTKIAWCL